MDYENCKCRKKLVDKLIDECTETIEEVKLAKISFAENENGNKYSSCTVPKEGLLIAILKSGRSLAELYKSKSNNAEIKEIKVFKIKMKEIRKSFTEKKRLKNTLKN